MAAYERVFRRSLIVGPVTGLVWALLAVGARQVLPPASWNARYGLVLVAIWGLLVWGVGIPVMVWRLLRRERNR